MAKEKTPEKSASELRDNLLGGSTEPRSEIVEFKGQDGKPIKYEVREPSLFTRNFARAQSIPAGQVMPDLEQLEIRLFVKQTFKPGTSERIFQDGDFKVIMEGAVGQKWVMKLRAAAARMSYVWDAAEEEDAKNG